MESLVHYQILLVRRHHAALGDEECERLRANSLELLRQLEVLDPLRGQRYRDLGERSVHLIAREEAHYLLISGHSIGPAI